MPKKSRRTKARYRAKTSRTALERHPQQARVASTRLPTASHLPSKTQELTSRHQHVIPELKRIGMIAGAMIIVLIIISYFLR